MNLRAHFRELTKVAGMAPPSPSKPIPINAVAPSGPRVPTNGLGTLGRPKLAEMNTFALPPAPSPQSQRLGAQVAPPPASKVPPPPNTVIRPVAGAVANQEHATSAVTLPPRSMPAPAAAPASTPPASGVFPRAQPVGTVQAPVTAQTGRAYAQQRAAMAGPKDMRHWAGKVAEADPGHGQPGHDHAASVSKLKAIMLQKHPHLLGSSVKKASVGDMLRSAGTNLVKHEDAHEIAGLASLALPSIDNIQARLRGGDEENDKHILPEYAHDAMEIGGLGYLAAPLIAKKGLGRAAVQAIEAQH